MDLGADGALIVGGGQAGAQCAASLRQNGYDGPITLAGEEPVAPYQRPPLSKAYLLGTLEADRLEAKPAAFYDEAKITLALNARATAIDRSAREVWFHGGARRRYGALVLATGASARRLAVPGADLEGVMTLRTRADADALRARLEAARQVVVIGGGYIGLETAAAARAADRPVTVVEAAPRLLARVAGPEIAAFYRQVHETHGVAVRLEGAAEAFLGDGAVTGVALADGTRLEGDLVIVGVGARANDDLARAAGLACEDGIMTDAHGRTEDPHIFAIGDCARAMSPLYQRPIRFEAVQNALDGAKAVAAVLTGATPPTAPVPWNWSDQYDLKLQTAGVRFEDGESVVRGDPDAGAFAVFTLHDGRVTACDAVNDPASFVAARQLIARRQMVAPERLRDTSAPAKALLTAS